MSVLVRAGRLAGALLSSGSRSGHFKLPWRSCCGIYTRAHRSFSMWRDGQLSLNVGHGYLVCTRRHPHKKGRPPLYVDAGWAWREQTESTSGQRAPTPTTRAPVRGALVSSPKAASALVGHFSSSLFLSAHSFFRVPRHVHQGWWGLSYGRRRSSARRRRSTEEFVFSRDHQRSIVRVPRPQAA